MPDKDSEKYVAVLVALSSAEDAAAMARTLVEEELAACGQVVGPIRSIYRWQGRIEDEPEALLILKTRAGVFEALKERVLEL
ncbi:MAG: divalent-cation tolerance protein CutA, partial [Gemmatimonadota bacterium]|nr:divalent-cation tolerance protein CutA [Gemmatimonadota bacterium]